MLRLIILFLFFCAFLPSTSNLLLVQTYSVLNPTLYQWTLVAGAWKPAQLTGLYTHQWRERARSSIWAATIFACLYMYVMCDLSVSMKGNSCPGSSWLVCLTLSFYLVTKLLRHVLRWLLADFFPFFSLLLWPSKEACEGWRTSTFVSALANMQYNWSALPYFRNVNIFTSCSSTAV